MQDSELDKILKEKLKGKIVATPELEKKIAQKVEEQKKIEHKKGKKHKKHFAVKQIISIAAVLVIALSFGIILEQNSDDIFKKEIVASKIKAIEPTKLQTGIIANDTEFIIKANENSSKEGVRQSLYIEPALEYTIEETSNKDEYKLKFKQNIPDNIILKLQYVKDKIAQDSWAYQTSNKLSVTKTYPNNYENTVSRNTVIEVELSYANVENFGENVSIMPKVEGNWVHLGKTWRFTPSKQLDEQKYTVSIKNGLKTQEEKLENDYNFSFIVKDNPDEEISYNTYSVDGISTYNPKEQVKIYYINRNEKEVNISNVEISKFTSVDSFINYLETGDKGNASKVGSYEFDINKKENYIGLKKNLQEGYYIASVKNESKNEIFSCPIQISSLNAYAMETERDVLIWVADENGLAKNINVQYAGKQKTTDNEGIVKFEGIADESEIVKYAKIGNSENKLVVGLYNYKFNNYPRAYLYTDRPLYKNTDTINIWGFIPRKIFYGDLQDEFYIQIANEEKQKVKVDEDGNFNYKIQLENRIDEEYCTIEMYYKDEPIAYRSITIENYELQNYKYEVIANKNYAFTGTNYEFDVKVTHITGIIVPNKSVIVKIGNKTLKGVTGENGLAHFSIKIDEEPNTYSYLYSNEIDVYNGDAEEYTIAENYKVIYIMSRNVFTEIEAKEDKKYEIKLHKLLEDKNVNVSYDIKELYNGMYDTQITVNLIETVSQKHISGYIYNEYTKENEPQYEWTYSDNTTNNIATISTRNGIAEFDANNIKMKNDTENTGYSYTIQFEFNDANGKNIKETAFLYNAGYNQTTNEIGYHYNLWTDGSGSDDKVYYISSKINSEYYYTYRYFLKSDYGALSIGDTRTFELYESTLNGNKQIKNEGQLLRIISQEEISRTDIIKDDDFKFTFSEKDFPGCKMTTAYYYKGKFYRMPTYYIDFKEQDRKVDIEIETDKEQYKPGEEVTVKVKTTNNGKPIKTFVNISVVNEAIFELENDYTNIFEMIYMDKDYPIYTYSSNMDYLYGQDDYGGGGGESRGEFADTAHFETVHTNSNGEATIKFKLPDNVTTYRITAHSANEDMYIGVEKKDIVSTLDFFVQSTMPRGVKNTDDLVLNATSVSKENFDVQYEFIIKELNKTLTVTKTTNSIATVNFGKLECGTYHAVIKGKYGEHEDSIEYEFNVVGATQEVKNKTELQIKENVKITPTKNPIRLEIYNKNMKQYLKYIDFVEGTINSRLDTQIAYNEIVQIKNKYYNQENIINKIDMRKYQGTTGFKNLQNAKEDMLLTALISYYAKDYYGSTYFEKNTIENDTNLYEAYLLYSANQEPVLNDLIYLKENNSNNYNKLLLTLSFEFLGDYQNAKDLYSKIQLNSEEVNEYKSLTAIIETFISKNEAIKKIDEMIDAKSSDEYLRFAILSFFSNSSEELKETESVQIICGDINETITLNGMQVKTYLVSNKNLKDITFNTSSNDLMVSYYYQTLLENVSNGNVVKDMNINISGNTKKYNTVTLNIDFENSKACDIKIALPNSLRLAIQDNGIGENTKYYLRSNNIDYIIIHKNEKVSNIKIPLLVVYEGEYKFESIVVQDDGIYHISNSLDLNIE